jgi:hypothetical protein
MVAIKHSCPATPVTNHPVVGGERNTNHCADYCVKARAVAATGQDRDLHAGDFSTEVMVFGSWLKPPQCRATGIVRYRFG